MQYFKSIEPLINSSRENKCRLHANMNTTKKRHHIDSKNWSNSIIYLLATAKLIKLNDDDDDERYFSSSGLMRAHC